MVSDLMVHSIDYYDECWPLTNGTSFDNAIPDDTSAEEMKISFVSGSITQASVSTNSSVLSWTDDNTAVFEFVPGTKLL